MPETEDHTNGHLSRRTKRKRHAINYYEHNSAADSDGEYEEDEEEESHDDDMDHLNIDASTQESFFNRANRQAHDDTLGNRFEGHHDLLVDQDLHAQPEGNLHEASKGWNIAELPKTVDKWEGCELVAEKDGTFALYTEENERLLRSILSDRTEGLFVVEERDEFTSINSMKTDRWVVANVLPRARNLYKVELLTPTANKRKSQTKENFYKSFSVKTNAYDNAESEEEKRKALSDMRHATTKALYIGYSMYMLGPVFMRPPRPTTKGETRANVREYNFRASEFKREPGGHTSGGMTLVHHSACTRANFLALKKLAAGGTMGAVFSDGDKPLAKYCEQINNSLSAVSEGKEAVPLAKFRGADPNPFDHMKRNPLSQYTTSERPESTSLETPRPDYPINEDMLCDGALLARGTPGAGPTGYVFEVPYMATLAYPQELIDMLRSFARGFPKDLLSMRLMLLAATIWKDIMVSPMRSQEMCVDATKASQAWKVPEVRLAPFIVYFPHWLRWTENMGLTEYLHPFRFVSRALQGDAINASLRVDENLLSEEEVSRLLGLARPKVRGISPGSRKRILPHMFPGSLMPRMVRVEPYVYPRHIEKAMMGLPDILHVGTPDYHRVKMGKERNCLQIVIPRRIVEGLEALDWELLGLHVWEERTLHEYSHETPTMICMPKARVGMQWEDITRGFATAGSQHETKTRARPRFDMRIHITPALQNWFMEDMILNMKRLLEDEGCLMLRPGKAMRLSPEGMWMEDGSTSRPFEYDVYPPEPYISDSDVIRHGSLQPHYSCEEDDLGSESSLESSAEEDKGTLLQDAIDEALTKRPHTAHPVWNTVADKVAKAKRVSMNKDELEAMLEEAGGVEEADLKTFEDSLLYCEMATRPIRLADAPLRKAMRLLISALHRLCGATEDEALFSEERDAEEEATSLQSDALKATASLRDPDHADTFVQFVDTIELHMMARNITGAMSSMVEEHARQLQSLLRSRQLAQNLKKLLDSRSDEIDE
jgi:hypothetical protein